MRSKSKKLIALLSVCCLATAAAAFVGCGKSSKDDSSVEAKDPKQEVYEMYLAQAGEGAMTYEEWLESLKGCQHTYEGEVIELVAPTGLNDGMGYQVCTKDGHVELVVLPKLAGVIPENPIELKVGEAQTIAINAYDSDRYGVDIDRGEKGVMYFKTTIGEVSGALLSLQASAGNAEFSYYGDEDYNYSSSRFVSANSVVYIKATFTGTYPAEVEINSKLTPTVGYGEWYTDGFVSNTISLSQGTATGLKVYEWGTLYDSNWNVIGEGWKEWAGASERLVNNADGTFTFIADYTEKYKVELEGLAAGYYVKDDAESLIIEYPADGSNDEGCDIEVNVGTYEAWEVGTTYAVVEEGKTWAQVTVETAGDYIVTLSDLSEDDYFGYERFVLMVNGVEQGEAYYNRNKVYQGTFVGGNAFGASIETTVSLNAGVNYFYIATQYGTASMYDVMATVTAVETNTPGGEVAENALLLGVTKTVEEEGEYIFTAEVAGTYAFIASSESGTIFTKEAWDAYGDPFAVASGTIELEAGETLTVIVSNNGDGNFDLTVCEESAVATTLFLGTTKTVEEDGEYTFTAAVGGVYNFVASSESGTIFTKEAWDAYGDPFAVASGTIELEAGETLTIVVSNNGDGDFDLTVTLVENQDGK